MKKTIVDRFEDFCFYQKELFIILFCIIICLIATPINFSIVKPFQNTFNIPETYTVKDRECDGFSIYFSSCKELETTHEEKWEYMILIFFYLIETIIAAISGYYLNKKLIYILG